MGAHCQPRDAKLFLAIVNDRLKPIPVDAFNGHVERMHADRDRWFELEYSVSAVAIEEGCLQKSWHTSFKVEIDDFLGIIVQRGNV